MACDLSPLGVECVYGDGHQLICCAVHHLNCTVRNLQQSLPIIGNWFEGYHCPDFEIEKEKKIMEPRNYIGCGEAKVCSDIPTPITPIGEMLMKMNDLAVEIRENSRYIDSSMFPSYNPKNGTIPEMECCVDNLHDHLKSIMQTLATANETLMHVRNCL